MSAVRYSQTPSAARPRSPVAQGLRAALALLALMFALGLHPVAHAQVGTGEVLMLTADGPVTPALGGYLERGLQEAEASNAELLVLRLDTPGGSVEVMGQIVRLLSNASVPTLVYVWPPGGQAASAGTFLTLTADLAAMAPNTTIGAASVVGGSGEEVDETLQRKITNDLRAMIRAQTERRGPEAVQWAEDAITDAVAANATEALELGIIDFVATDTVDLLQQADGTTVTLANDEQRTLAVATAPVRELPMGPLETLLHVITDPNIALLLISLGGIALYFEFASPGGYVGGIFGVIATLLGLYALGALNANWVGLALIGLALALFLVELKTATVGVFLAGGIAAFIIGSVVLFQNSYAEVSLPLVIGAAIGVGLFFALALAAVLRDRERPAITGRQGLIGAQGEVRRALGPGQVGIVLVQGERWQAAADVPIPDGAAIRVVAAEGIHLRVAPLAPTPIQAPSTSQDDLNGEPTL